MSTGITRSRRPTIHDVAARAGVSSQTVTRYVRGFEGIRPATRERVRIAIDELGWRPNSLARALRMSTGNRILLFVHEFSETGPSNIILAATKRARKAGYVLDVVPLDARDIVASEAAIASVDQHYVAGVLAFAPTPELADLFDRSQFAVPVLREVNGDGLEGPRSQGELEPGTIEAVRHLHDLGHRDLYLIDGPTAWYSSRKRRAAALATARELGMTVVGEQAGDWSAASGYEAASVDLGDATAIVAANDEMAIGAIAALHSRGVRVPEDVSVVGFDDIQLAAYTVPALTTVHVDFRASGRLAVERLLQIMAGDVVPDQPVGPPTTQVLVDRASTAIRRP